MEDNLSVVLYKKNDLRTEQRPIPTPGENEVLIRMGSVGICGSDIHLLTTGNCGPFMMSEKMLIGHEGSGTVVKCGAGVKHLLPGDRVAIEPGVPCRICEHCKSGAPNRCPKEHFGNPTSEGCLSRYYKHTADLCHKLPPNVSLEEGAMFEPFSVAIHACRRAGVTGGHKVLVCGAGAIGLLNMMTARAMGASQVIMTDISPHRLEVARSLGANITLDVSSGSPEEIAKKVEGLLGSMPDVTLECSGVETSIQLALHATKSGGTVTLVGMRKVNVTVPLMAASVREVDIRGVFRYQNCYPIALALVSSGQVNLKPLITHRFPLEEALAAFDMSRTGAGGAIKVMIKCSNDQ